jgi:hypothetical protein
LGKDRFLIAYSWFTPPSGRKSIYVREVSVSITDQREVAVSARQ